MKIDQAVWNETKKIALGTGILCALMIGVFLIVKKFDITVVWGTLLGGGFAILNFFLLALGVQRAAQKSEEEAARNPQPAETEEETDGEEDKDIKKPANKQVKGALQLSYNLRLLLTAAVAIVGVKLDCFNTVAVILPLFFPRIVLLIKGFVMKRKGASA